MPKQDKLDYISMCKRGNEGYHWDFNNGKFRIAMIRGGPPGRFVVHFEDRTKDSHSFGTLWEAMEYLIKHFVETNP